MAKQAGAVPFKIENLYSAVKSCQLYLVKKILTRGIPESGQHVTDYSILQMALKSNQRKIAKLLIDAGCRIEASSSERGLTPLALAFMYEDQEIALMILKNGATIYVNYDTNRSTVLHLAVQRKSLKMLQFVLNYNIDVNLLDSKGKTALQILFETCINQESNNQSDKVNKCEMMRLLLSKGASVDIEDSDGKTLLHDVVLLKQEDIITSVLHKMKDVNSCDVKKRTALHYLLYNDYESEDDIIEIVKLFIEKGAKIDIADWQNVTVSHIAAGRKYLKIMNEFLECQCNVSLKDYNGNTVLHKLLECSAHLSGKKDFINLANSVLCIAPLENIQNSFGKTPLHLAAENYHYKILDKMLPKFTNPNIGDSSGETVLHTLSRQFSNKNYDIIKCLLNAGANVDMKNAHGISPVDLALGKGNKNLLLPVLEHSKILNQSYFQQKSILHYLSNISVDSKSEELEVEKIARSCIEQGLQVDILDGLKRTPLCAAVLNRCKNMVKILLEFGANPNFSTSIGIIQYIVARPSLSNLDLEIADMLVSKGATTLITFEDLMSLIQHLDLHKKIIKLLNKCGNLNVLDSAANTVLHAILDSNFYTKQTIYSIFKVFSNFLLSKGISVDAKNGDGETLLHLAAKNAHYKIVEILLPKFENVNVIDNHGKTLLHVLSTQFSEENYAIVLHLLSSGADVDMKSAHGITPVDIGLEIGNKYLLLPLLPCSKNLKQYFFQGRTVLHYLCDIHIDSQLEEFEVAEIAENCIEQGIYVDVLDDILRTPLLAAVLNHNKYMIEFLCKHGANPNYSTPDGAIIEYLITKPRFLSSDLEIAELLISKGAGTIITFTGLVSLLRLTDTNETRLLIINLLDKCENLNVLDSFGNTILHAFLNSKINDKDANRMNILEIIEILIGKGVSVNTKNNEGITALHLAAKNKHGLISEFLIKNRANVTALDNEGNTVLHFVSMLKVEIDADVEKTMIDLFIDKGCNVNAKNVLNVTPLLTATSSGCINVVKALIVCGADIRCAGGEKVSYPLHVAVEKNHATIIEHLLNCGANMYDKRKDGKTALHVAAIYGKLGTLIVLLERLMDPDARDDNGRTALHWASWCGNLEIVRELLIWGADVNAENEYKVTPIVLSQSSDNAVWDELQRYIEILKTAGVNIAKQSIHCIKNKKKRIDTGLIVSRAETEVLRMQWRQINNSTTLADVLKMNLNKLAIFKNHKAFKELITSENFVGDFPCYSPIIKSFCARGIIRSNLFNEATEVLRELRDSTLPEDCTHEIFQYLSNDDLINLIQAKLPNSKSFNKIQNQHWDERRLHHQEEIYVLMSI